MNIAFVINNYPPKVGGLEQHVSALSAELHRLGHKVTIVTLSDTPGVSVENGIKVYRLKEYLTVDGILGFPSLVGLTRLAKVLKRENIDVISIHTRFFSMSWFGVALGRMMKIPVVHTEHGSGFVVSEKAVIRLASQLVDRTLGVLTLRAASKVLGVSQPSCDFVKKLSGVDAEVFYNVSPLPMAAPEDVVFQRKKLVFLARVVEVKGWRAFLETVQQLHAEDAEITGVVLGAGADLEKAKAYAAELGISDAVDFKGFVDHATVARELRGATLVNPTVAAEGFQTTIIDAYVSQAAIVTYDVSSARVLKDAGVRVHIVEQQGVPQLAAAVRAELAQGPQAYPVEDLQRWGWASQGKTYEQIVQTYRHKIHEEL
ncbi:MAG TPA: glycosyltransferase family 4 protein [Candidatus Rothia avicola]|uniref:Glycosyltransferase family 4 protein n=1 Tax=Candidatus Rothia avicola TaxID=2840478 RepID=A0A9D2CQM0_9MICC|nr:glycosyltransferase family 4 protein [Candidatus Rothia avicola]